MTNRTARGGYVDTTSEDRTARGDTTKVKAGYRSADTTKVEKGLQGVDLLDTTKVETGL